MKKYKKPQIVKLEASVTINLKKHAACSGNSTHITVIQED